MYCFFLLCCINVPAIGMEIMLKGGLTMIKQVLFWCVAGSISLMAADNVKSEEGFLGVLAVCRELSRTLSDDRIKSGLFSFDRLKAVTLVHDFDAAHDCFWRARLLSKVEAEVALGKMRAFQELFLLESQKRVGQSRHNSGKPCHVFHRFENKAEQRP